MSFNNSSLHPIEIEEAHVLNPQQSHKQLGQPRGLLRCGTSSLNTLGKIKSQADLLSEVRRKAHAEGYDNILSYINKQKEPEPPKLEDIITESQIECSGTNQVPDDAFDFMVHSEAEEKSMSLAIETEDENNILGNLLSPDNAKFEESVLEKFCESGLDLKPRES